MATRSNRSICNKCGGTIKKGSPYFIIYQRLRDSRSMSNSESGVCPDCLVKTAQEMVDKIGVEV